MGNICCKKDELPNINTKTTIKDSFTCPSTCCVKTHTHKHKKRNSKDKDDRITIDIKHLTNINQTH